jgi:hypothetical protein
MVLTLSAMIDLLKHIWTKFSYMAYQNKSSVGTEDAPNKEELLKILNTHKVDELSQLELARCKTIAEFPILKELNKEELSARFILALENLNWTRYYDPCNIRTEDRGPLVQRLTTLCTFAKSDDEVKACKLMMIRYGIDTPKTSGTQNK